MNVSYVFCKVGKFIYALKTRNPHVSKVIYGVNESLPLIPLYYYVCTSLIFHLSRDCEYPINYVH